MPIQSSFLSSIEQPADLRALPRESLPSVCEELRHETILAVSETGGHLGAGLGVIELTVALHAVFDTPDDILVFDVGHQCYPHKILTGRRDRIRTLRQGGGLSGFTRRSESVYDPFGAAHSSTAISAGLGFAVGRDLAGGSGHVVCVVGDGAMSAGMAYEAINNAGRSARRLIVILNDNDMSISPPSAPWRNISRGMRQADGERSSVCSHLGLTCLGPVDGHNVHVGLVDTLETAAAIETSLS